jgi:hypothetical protein
MSGVAEETGTSMVVWRRGSGVVSMGGGISEPGREGWEVEEGRRGWSGPAVERVLGRRERKIPCPCPSTLRPWTASEFSLYLPQKKIQIQYSNIYSTKNINDVIDRT